LNDPGHTTAFYPASARIGTISHIAGKLPGYPFRIRKPVTALTIHAAN
jgi:hypothetical protein